MRVIRAAGAMREEAAAWRRGGRRIALVPTMGAIHAGHLSLVARARPLCDSLVVSLFVNPAQFAPGEDPGRYPRSFNTDRGLCEAAGADVLFAPAPGEIYPPGFCTWVEPGGPAQRYEGELRPDHFRGVATVVLKLFEIVRPEVAVFGQKDAQQVAVLRRLIGDLDLPVALEIGPTVREPDGLALSSRNVRLDPRRRAAAPALHRSLREAAEAHRRGERRAEELRRIVHRALEAVPGLQLDYVDVVDAGSFEPVDDAGHERALLIAAARAGDVRLLDNLPLGARAGSP